MKNIFLAVLFLAASASSVFAEDLTGRFGVGGSVGAGIPVGVQWVTDRNDTGVAGGGWLAYGLDRYWTLRANYDYLSFSRGKTRLQDLVFGFGYNFAPESKWNPTLRAALGPAWPRVVQQNGGDSVLGLNLGLGVDRFVCSHFTVGATLDYLYSLRAQGAMREIHALRPGLTAGYWFGAPSKAPVVAEAPAPAPAPRPAPAKPAPAKVQITLAVQFDTAKDVVKPQYDDELQKVAKFLKEHPSTTAEIEGHTDNVGGGAYNKDLSQRRAAAVRQALIDRFACDGARLTSAGYGEDQPIADNATEAGRAQNRRVVATFTSAN